MTSTAPRTHLHFSAAEGIAPLRSRPLLLYSGLNTNPSFHTLGAVAQALHNADAVYQANAQSPDAIRLSLISIQYTICPQRDLKLTQHTQS